MRAMIRSVWSIRESRALLQRPNLRVTPRGAVVLAAVIFTVLFIASFDANAAPTMSTTSASQISLPAPVPQEVIARGSLSVGVKCDYPPFGFIGANDQPQGFDVDVARQLAQYAFGDPNRVHLQCVTSANRIPYLTTDRVDILIATLGYNKERAGVISYSKAYFSSTGRLLVKKDSHITSTAELRGNTVLLSVGTPYVPWFQQCMPDVSRIEFDTASEGLMALLQGRGAAYVDDDTLLVNLAAKNPALAVVGDTYSSVWGLGMRKGDSAMESWVNAAITMMQQEDKFWTLFKKWIPEPDLQSEFAKAMPRPGNNLSYPTGPLFTCPSSQ